MNFAFALALVLAAPDRPVIDLSGGRIQPLPLAVARQLPSPEDAAAVQAVLVQDFERSGLFKLLDPASFLAAPGEGFIDIDFQKWQAIGAQALVKMSCEALATEVRCDMRLYDVARGRSCCTAPTRPPSRPCGSPPTASATTS